MIDDADDLVLDDERDGELGADVGVGVDVVVGFGDVLDEDGLALEGGLADDAAAELDAHAFDLGGVADLEAHAEVFGAVVEEEDGEDAVVDDGADEVGDAVHEGVEVEGGVEGVGEVVEEVDLEGLDADFGVGGVWVKESGRGGAVVAFEGVFGRDGLGGGGFGGFAVCWAEAFCVAMILPGGVRFGECLERIGRKGFVIYG